MRCLMRLMRSMVACALAAGLPACAMRSGTPDAFGPWPVQAASVEVVHRQTIDGVGAAQGLVIHEGLVYVFGDADTGVIREYRVAFEQAVPRLVYTGREILCTVDGADIAPHPTGLTFHPEFGCYLGDTVRRVGTIFRIDWERALADGTLDNAILQRIDDDAAVNGTRPEFVELDDRWYIATADYGDVNNQVRLYDPTRLARAERTSEAGVLVDSIPSGAFVQSMRWLPESGYLVLAQNQIAGLYYRLTFLPLAEAFSVGDATRYPVIDIPGLDDELEGWTPLGELDERGEGWCVMVSAMRDNNVSFVRMRLPSGGR